MVIEIPVIEDLFSQTLSKLSLLELKLIKSSQINDLTLNEIRIIQNIGINEKKTMSQLSRNLEITPGALTPSIDRLLKKGYLTRRHSEEDRRIVIVELTPKGAYAYTEYTRIHSEITQQILNFLTIEEGVVLFKTLEKFTNYLDQRLKNKL